MHILQFVHLLFDFYDCAIVTAAVKVIHMYV